MRLQEELVRSSDDESIFAWSCTPDVPFTGIGTLHTGLLFAHTPLKFAACANVERANFELRAPFSMTNRALRIDAILDRILFAGNTFSDRRFLMHLNCGILSHSSKRRFADPRDSPLALCLVLIDSDRNFYWREGCVNIAQSRAGQRTSFFKMRDRQRAFERKSLAYGPVAVNFILFIAGVTQFLWFTGRGRGWWLWMISISLILLPGFVLVVDNPLRPKTKTIFITKDPRKEEIWE